MKTILCLIFGLSVGFLMYKFLTPLAYAERGYEAFGGEWLIIFIIGWASCLLMRRLIENA